MIIWPLVIGRLLGVLEYEYGDRIYTDTRQESSIMFARGVTSEMCVHPMESWHKRGMEEKKKDKMKTCREGERKATSVKLEQYIS